MQVLLASISTLQVLHFGFLCRCVSVGFWFIETPLNAFVPPQALVNFLQPRQAPVSTDAAASNHEVSHMHEQPIFFGFGSMGAVGLNGTHSKDFAKVIVNCLKLMKRRGIVFESQFTGFHRIFWQEAIDAGRLYVIDKGTEVPYSWLFAQCSLCVHHGGSGSTSEALRAGVPQLVLPVMFDQFFWAEKVQDLGVGDRLSFSGVNLVTLSDKLNRVLKPRFRERAQEVAQNMRNEIDFARHCVVEILDNAFEKHKAYAEKHQDQLAGMPMWPYPHLVSLRAPEPFIGPSAKPDEADMQPQQAVTNLKTSAPIDVSADNMSDDSTSQSSHKRRREEIESARLGIESTTIADNSQSGHSAEEKPNEPLEVYSFLDEETAFMHSEIFVRDVYFQDFLTLDEGATVIDVGANIGLFLLHVARKVKSFKALAFEPIPPIFHTLEQNLKINGIAVIEAGSDQPADPDESAQSTKLFQCALSSTPSKSESFVFYPNTGANSTRTSLIPEKEAQRSAFRRPDVALRGAVTFECEVKTLSDVLRDENVKQVDVLKVDVEGSELAVLEGIKKEDFAKIRQVSIEVFSAERRDKIQKMLESHGFETKCSVAHEVADTFFVLARKPAAIMSE